MAVIERPSAGDHVEFDNDLRELARGSRISFVGVVVSTVANLLMLLVVTRSYGKDLAGSFFAVAAIFAIVAQVSALGAETGIVRFISRSLALDRPYEVRAHLRAGLVPVAVLSGVMAVVTAAGAARLGSLVGGSDPSDARTLVSLVAIAIPAAALLEVVLGALRGLRCIGSAVRIEHMARPLAQLLLIAIGSELIGPSAGVLAVGFGLPYVAAVLAGAIVLRRAAPPRGADEHHLHGAPSAGFWGFSGPRAGARLLQTALQRFDIVLVAALRGPGDAAVYAAATRFLVVGILGVQAVQQVVQPKLAELLTADDLNRTRGVFQSATAWLTAVSWPVYLVLIGFADVLSRVFGEGYRGGAIALVILASAQLFATATGPVDVLLLMAGRSTWSMANAAAAFAIDVVLIVALVPTYGVAGAALARAIAVVFANGAPALQVLRWFHVHPISPALVRVALWSSGCVAAAVALRLALPPAVALVMGAPVALICYSLGCWHRRQELSLDPLFDALVPARASRHLEARNG